MTDVSPEEALAVWNGLKRPSARAVAEKLQAAGRKIHAQTIYNWKRNNWKRKSYGVEQDANDLTEVERAEDALERTIPAITHDAKVSLADLIPDHKIKSALGVYDKDRDDLEELTDLELVNTANRRVSTMVSLISREIAVQRATLIATNPEGLGALLKALGVALEASNTGYKDFLRMQDSLMKTMNGKATAEEEIDPLEREMKAWGTMPDPEPVQ